MANTVPNSNPGPQAQKPSRAIRPEAVMPSQRIPGSQFVYALTVMVIAVVTTTTVFMTQAHQESSLAVRYT